MSSLDKDEGNPIQPDRNTKDVTRILVLTPLIFLLLVTSGEMICMKQKRTEEKTEDTWSIAELRRIHSQEVKGDCEQRPLP